MGIEFGKGKGLGFLFVKGADIVHSSHCAETFHKFPEYIAASVKKKPVAGFQNCRKTAFLHLFNDLYT